MADVVLHPIAEENHIAPTLPIARALRSRGDNVCYLLEEDARKRIEREGFAFEPYLGELRTLGYVAHRRHLSGRDREEQLRRDHEAEWAAYTSRVLHNQLRRLAPDVLIADLCRPHATLTAHSCNIRFIRYNASFPSQYAEGRPPLWSGELPNAMSSERLEELWAANNGVQSFRRVAVSQNYYENFYKEFEDAGLCFSQFSEQTSATSFLVRTDPEIVMASAAFDFSFTPAPGQVYLGPCVEPASVPPESRPHRRSTAPLIVVDFDGLEAYRSKPRKILSTFRDVATLRPDWDVLIRSESPLPEAPENLIVAGQMPLADDLSGASVFVSTANLAAAQTAIMCGVPQLAMPQHREQHGTAARICFHGVGQRAQGEAQLVASETARSIDALLDDHAKTRAISAMQKQFSTGSCPEKALEHIDAVLHGLHPQPEVTRWHAERHEEAHRALWGD